MQFIFATMPNQVANNQVEILRLLCPPVLLIMDKFGVASTRNCVQIGIFCRHRMAKTRQNTHTLTRFVMFLRGFCVHTHLLITAKFGLQNRRMISAYVPNNFFVWISLFCCPWLAKMRPKYCRCKFDTLLKSQQQIWAASCREPR